MIQQWWHINSHTLSLCISSPKKLFDNAIIFLPGLGQTKAGSYFLYSQIAQHFCNCWDTYQIDYWGFGDSGGNTEDCEYADIQNDCKGILDILCAMYTQVIIISSGFANAIAYNIGIGYTNTRIFLIEPERNCDKFVDILQYIIKCQQNKISHIDTSDLYLQYPSAEEAFWALGEGYNRCKGLYLKTTFLKDMIEHYKIRFAPPKTCVFSGIGANSYSNYLINAHHISLSPKAREELLYVLRDEQNTH